jgi:hypothetical protein
MSLAFLIAAIVMTAIVAFQFACRGGAFGPRMQELATRHSRMNVNIVLAAVLWAAWLYLRG